MTPTGPALVRAKAMFDGERRVGMPRVLIDRGLIVDIAVGHDPVVPPGTAEIDLHDETLLPGLIDAHVHATLARGLYPPDSARAQRETAIGNLRAAARSGITTVRDCGSQGNTMRELRDRPLADMSRPLIAGPALTIRGGHARTLGREISDESDMVSAIEELALYGVDLIKIIGCGGGTPGTDPLQSSFTLRELKAAVATATSHGLPVTVHALNSETVGLALRAGVRFFEHGWLYQAEPTKAETATLAELAQTSAVVCPTIWATAHQVPAIRERLRSAEGDEVARSDLDAALRRREAVMRSVSDSHHAGVRIVAGTDAAWRDVKFTDLVEEILLFERCGMTTTEALMSATSTSADALGIGAEKGRIATGRTADLIAVRGDPMVDLESLRDVRWTMIAGHAFGSAEEKQ